MLSFKTGAPLAEVEFKPIANKEKKSRKRTQIIKLNEEISEEPEIMSDNVAELIPKSFFSGLRHVSAPAMILLKRAIRAQDPLLLAGRYNLGDIYRAAMEVVDELQRKCFYISPAEGSIMPIPLQESSRISVLGPSGVGKSTWTGAFLEQYHKMYKKNKIYVFSPITEDKAFSKVKTEYIKLDSSIVDDPLDITEFKDTCLVFDDIEAITEKDVQAAVARFRDICLETGRHENITVICVSHIILNGPQTKRMLNESDEVVVFPRSNFQAIKNLCTRYYGFGKAETDFIKTAGNTSRWCMIKRSYPTCIVTSNTVKLV